MEAQSSQPGPAAPPPALPGWRPLRIGEWRLLALIVLLFILRDMPWRLEESGQANQAFGSLEMVHAGHWWFQHLPGSTVAASEPPLTGWISSGLYYGMLGNWDLAWRLPSLFSVLAVIVLLWRAGEDLWPQWGGTIAAAAFALNFLTPRIAMLVRPEPLLALETTVLGLVIWNHVRNGRPWSTGARWLVFGVLLAALMTDGPIVCALLFPGMAVHRWICGRRDVQPTGGVWGGWWHWTLPLLPYLFWLERGLVNVPGFYQQVIGHPFLGSSASGAAVAPRDDEPLYFYVLELLVCWAPWSILFLAVRLRAPRVWWRLCKEPGPLWLVCWSAGGLACLTLLRSRFLERLLPIVPPLCLLLTAAIAAVRNPASPAATGDEAAWPKNWSRLTLWLACAATVGATIASVSLVYRRGENLPSEFGARVRSMTEPARCELVLARAPTAADASMLVYLRRLSYLDPPQAIQLESTGQLDRIVLDAGSPRGTRGLLARFDSSHPLLVCGSGQFVLLCDAADAPEGSKAPR